MRETEALDRDEVLARYTGCVWKPWQHQVLQKLERDPHPTEIVWIHTSWSGKTYLAMYIEAKYPDSVVMYRRNPEEILSEVNARLNGGSIPKIAICDDPCEDPCAALEVLKDGAFHVDGDTVVIPKMHVYVFASAEPDVNRSSPHKWDVRNV